MKKLAMITGLLMVTSTSAFAQSEFCQGFKGGYKTGYKQASGSSHDPYTPHCPHQPHKNHYDPESDYEHGYLIGLKEGLRKG